MLVQKKFVVGAFGATVLEQRIDLECYSILLIPASIGNDKCKVRVRDARGRPVVQNVDFREPIIAVAKDSRLSAVEFEPTELLGAGFDVNAIIATERNDILPGTRPLVTSLDGAYRYPIIGAVAVDKNSQVRVISGQQAQKPVARQLSVGADVIFANPVSSRENWRIRIQNRGGDPLIVAWGFSFIDPVEATNANSLVVESGESVELDVWSGVAMRLQAGAAVSPQVSPDDTRIVLMY